jgi:hypothetical protein
MIPFRAIAFSALLAFAPVAHAQVSCEDISETLDEALYDFDGIIGEEIEDDFYESDLWLPDATDCTVLLDWDAIYYCFWSHGSEAEARAAYADLTNVVAACLPDWKPESMLDETTAPETAVAYSVRSGSGEYQDIEVLVHLDRFEDGGQVTWEVWYELAYYLI